MTLPAPPLLESPLLARLMVSASPLFRLLLAVVVKDPPPPPPLGSSPNGQSPLRCQLTPVSLKSQPSPSQNLVLNPFPFTRNGRNLVEPPCLFLAVKRLTHTTLVHLPWSLHLSPYVPDSPDPFPLINCYFPTFCFRPPFF